LAKLSFFNRNTNIIKNFAAIYILVDAFFRADNFDDAQQTC
jgi:hypothetical protein